MLLFSLHNGHKLVVWAVTGEAELMINNELKAMTQ